MVIYRQRDKYLFSKICCFFGILRRGFWGRIMNGYTCMEFPLAEKIRGCQDEYGKTYENRRVHTWVEKKVSTVIS